MLVSHYDVHTPIQANQTDINYYDKKKKLKKDYGNFIPGYAAMIRNVDNSVGLIRKRLERNGLIDNTILLFLSDNGACSHLTPSPFRGTKGTLYEGGLRVPFIVSWKGKLSSNKELKGSYGMVDLMPTIAHLVGYSRNTLFQFLNNNRDVSKTNVTGKSHENDNSKSKINHRHHNYHIRYDYKLLGQPVDGSSLLPYLTNVKYLEPQNKVRYSAKNYDVMPPNTRLFELYDGSNTNSISEVLLEGNKEVYEGYDEKYYHHHFNDSNTNFVKVIIWHQPHYLNEYTRIYPAQNAPFGMTFNQLKNQGTWRTVPNSAILHHYYKLMKFWGPNNKTALNLFDIYHDPGESKNIAHEYPQVVSKLESLLDNHLRSRQSPMQLKKNPWYKSK